jgi:hypothetical protein
MKKKTSILFILTLSFGICFALILSVRSVLVHSTPSTSATITNNNNNGSGIINATSHISNTKKPTNAINNTFLATGSIASLLINTKESTPSEITSVNESNAIYNATITNASRGSSVNNGIVNRVEGNHTKTYNNNSTSPSESNSIVNSNIFSRTLDSYNSTSASQNLDDNMINLLTKLIMGSISGGSSSSRYPESITQAASTTQTETEKPFVLTGHWNLSVEKGNVRDFASNFTMVHIDGTGSHVIKLINFQADANRTVYLGSDGTTSIMGRVDIELNGVNKWKGVHAIIVIERLNTIYIILDSNATANYFKGQPIYGIIGLLKEGKNGNRVL